MKGTPVCWTVAGFDGGGGAGVLADLETFRALGARGAAVLTAVTAQGGRGVRRWEAVSPRLLTRQIECLLEQERPAAIKIGMLATRAIVCRLAHLLRQEPLAQVPVVLDPVLRASAGGALLRPGALVALRQRLVPRASVITPNAQEAAVLLGTTRPPAGRQARLRAARRLLRLGCPAVLLTGGDGRGGVLDVLAQPSGWRLLAAPRISARAHGTGCRHSSALTVGLARGLSLGAAARLAADFTRNYLRSCLSR